MDILIRCAEHHAASQLHHIRPLRGHLLLKEKALVRQTFLYGSSRGMTNAVSRPATTKDRLLTAPVRGENSLALAVPMT